MKKPFYLALLCFSLSATFAIAQSIPAKTSFVIQTHDALAASLLSKHYEVRALFPDLNIFQVKANQEDNLTKEALSRKQGIVFVSDKEILSTVRCNPNDSLFASQWNMQKINIEDVWCKSTGGTTLSGDTIVVGVMEPQGIYYQHKELLPNIWTNKAEIPDNNIDDDNNGYIDDYYGLNVAKMNDKHVAGKHGAEVLGVVGAKGDNVSGVTGANYNVKMMLVSQATSDADWLAGLNYFYEMRKLYNESNGKKGAFIPAINISSGFDYGLPQNFPLICQAIDKLGNVGILTVNATANSTYDIDIKGDIPGLCPSDYLIVVSNAEQDDTRGNAAYSKKSVDLYVPGTKILTTSLSNSYTTDTGTSLASPLAAGAIGLLYSLQVKGWMETVKTDPANAALQMKDFILKGVYNANSEFTGYCVSGGRLDLAHSMRLMEEQYTPIAGITINKVKTNSTSIVLDFETNLFATHMLKIYNTMGQLIKTGEYMPTNLTSNQYAIETSDLPNGVYVLQLANSTSKITYKFLALK